MRLDGSNIRSGTRCIYRIYAARYVRDLKENCGHIEINWYKTANTEEIPEEEWGNYLIPYHD